MCVGSVTLPRGKTQTAENLNAVAIASSCSQYVLTGVCVQTEMATAGRGSALPGPVAIVRLNETGRILVDAAAEEAAHAPAQRQRRQPTRAVAPPAAGAAAGKDEPVYASLDPSPSALLLGSPQATDGAPQWPLDGESSAKEAAPGARRCGRCRCLLPSWLLREPLLAATMTGVVAGIALGAALRPAELSEQAIELIGFPGEVMLRLLKLLVLPLVAASMVAGICALRESSKHSVARLAKITFGYYALSTLMAIGLGILVVVVVRPGRGSPLDHIAPAGGGCHAREQRTVATQSSHVEQQSATTALLNVARQVVPDNIAEAAVDTNVLGIITFSLMFGVALSSLGPAADGVIKAVGVLNSAVGRMVTAALYVSPVGVGSLIAASILRACDLWGTLSALGLWVATVVVGLAVFAAAVLPLMLLAATRRSPLKAARGFGQALLVALGTSSSAAALPLAMEAAREQGCEESTVNFFLPLGITVNMSGTALYEAVTAIFLAQAHGVQLGPGQLLVVAFTASLAAIGAPAIPSAGLVTQLIVLQAVGLGRFAPDLAAILAVDWLLDRLRTTVNLLGDGFGCLIVQCLMGSGGGGVCAASLPEQRDLYSQLELADQT
eukprot:scaffold14.g1057.t1